MNLNIKNFSVGVYLSNSSDSTVVENNVTNTNDGVVLRHFSNHNRILGNNIATSYYAGIDVSESENNTISGNYITNGSFRGIWLIYSSGNWVFENRITRNGNNTEGDSAVWCTDSSGNVFSGNQITDNAGDGFVIEWESENNTVLENNIINNHRGIWCSFGASGNMVSGNTITNNNCGIQIGEAANNVFFHNSFINNINQTALRQDHVNVWDDGYPSGGNYWSDHPCSDDDSDAICDAPYVLDENNIDNYPIVSDSR
jgi:parallel beta-helix repeat protein